MIITYVAAFFAGMLSFLSPCVLPLVPAYLSMVSGVSVDEIRASAKDQRVVVLRGTLLFVAGFTVVFVLLGAGASVIGVFLTHHKRWFEIASGVFIIAMGVFLIGVYRPRQLERERRFRVGESLGGWAAPLLGAAFAFGWTPCIGPTLGAVMGLAATRSTLAQGMSLLFVYSLGLAVPLVASGLALNKLSRVFGWVKRHFKAIEITSGALLVVFGVLLITNEVTRISGILTDLMTSIGLGRFTSS